MRVIGESHADLIRRYPGLYQTTLPQPASKPAKESFSKKWDKFMVRHPGAFAQSGVSDAMKRLGADASIAFRWHQVIFLSSITIVSNTTRTNGRSS